MTSNCVKLMCNYFLIAKRNSKMLFFPCRTFGPVQNVRQTFGPRQKVLDIWSSPKRPQYIWSMSKGPWHLVLSKTSMNIFGACQMVLDRTKWSCKCQGPFGVDQMSPWTFHTGPKMTRYQGPFGADQMSSRPKVFRTFWTRPNIC